MKHVAPSILSADFSRLSEEIKEVEKGGAKYLHIDVMDGNFVPNITIGPCVIKSIRRETDMVFDVHLMINNPEKYISDFSEAGADIITVHQEAGFHLHRTLQIIKNLGVKAGISLNPSTPVSTLQNVLQYVDLVLIMSVNPGFGGQEYISESNEKIIELAGIRKEKKYNFLIEVDGGIKESNIKGIADAGADIFVAGSEVFGADSPSEKIIKMQEIINNG